MSGEQGEFARGWPVLAASLLGVAVGVSSLYFYTLGIFIKPMAAEFGWSRGTASLGALVGTAAAALSAIPTGRLVDRIGSKRVALVSLALLGAGFVGMGALTTGMGSFLALSILVSLVTSGSGPVAFTRLVVAHFTQHRGMALGIVLAGTGAGAILIPMLLTPFVAVHGWRAGFYVLAGVIAVALPVLALLLSRCSDGARATAHHEVPLAALMREPAFGMLIVTFFLAATAILGTVVQFVPMLSDWGLSPAAAGSTTALIGVAAIAGRLIAGALIDRLPAYAVTAAMFTVAAIGLLTLGLGGAAYGVAGALVVGLAIGAEVDLIAFLVGRYFPPIAYGKAYGAIYACFLVGGAVGPALSGYLKDATGDYRASLVTAAALLTASSLTALRLRLYPAWAHRSQC
jgi:MFS family permease